MKIIKFLAIFLRIIIIVFVISVVILILNFRNNTPDCFVADQIVKLDTLTINKTNRIAVYRQTGLSEKMHFLELYADSAEFDACGNSTKKPIWGSAIDVPVCKSGQCIKGIRIIQDSIAIVYGNEDKGCVKMLDEMKFVE